MLRLVLDVSTLISASLWTSPSRHLLSTIRDGMASLFLSGAILEELGNTVQRTKFEARLVADGRSASDLVDGVRALARVVPASNIVAPQLRDQRDLHILACAVAARADLIVSGDRDLLSLSTFEGITIESAIDAARTLGYRG